MVLTLVLDLGHRDNTESQVLTLRAEKKTDGFHLHLFRFPQYFLQQDQEVVRISLHQFLQTPAVYAESSYRRSSTDTVIGDEDSSVGDIQPQTFHASTVVAPPSGGALFVEVGHLLVLVSEFLPFHSCLSGPSRPRSERQRSRTCWIRSSVHELRSIVY